MIPYIKGQLTQGKTAVVTGANRGIGKAITETLLAHGCKVIAAVRDTHSAKLLFDYNPQLHFVELDLSQSDKVKSAVKEVRAISKSVDILINCAGIASGSLFQLTSIEDMKQLFEVNLFNQLLLSQQISRLMHRQKSGCIINILSSATHQIDKGTLAYGCTKSAFERASLSMALELADIGIRVNAIAPGVTLTDMADEMDQQAKTDLVSRSLLKKAASAQDIANTALFLCSDLSSHITGQVINVDGGLI
ncbi:SDR family NAD(P)-dependent oxidoreductase [Pseudoalteromonas phenolica]|uniref:Short-chain dehydrogenase n=1 Tax=Pseudoalteromonas phenolica TaxID=161398 RepID=A0A0S2JZI1_9GAMM|nr:SDR family oxidoreductase [Pseudoalteromonas phenolica]ALO41436.1 short-chain dehydrogenase [Pseudoalteromonas phenolica]MBE0354018.1 7-alpha-hydroxysteroid dehydrogenase [Pseudoalteromonas phenolica O-BC30]RXE95892.1 SDR family oxidoreductase [Pseudoalteromonas phenolica O-BC30]TMO57478.1 SDR family NAD(P)-dependent oxidoreductase [Pseudoalteromonas phenolica]